jgi:DNA primase
MSQIPEEVIEEVKKSNNIVDVIGEYVQLRKQGRNYFGLCPFHGEKTPSFSVTDEKQIFHCFGCGKGGNVFTFLMEIESFSFFESLEFLADRSGVTLPQLNQQQRTSLSEENQQILEAFEWLTKLYHHLLSYTKDGKAGYDYFSNRSITDETIDTFQLGFAPDVKDFIVEFLTKKGFNKQLLIKAGFVSEREDNSISDRFQGRVIFPIRNHLGKTVAFAGRSIQAEDRGPKYLNSPESELFQKGKLLYNFDLAKRHIRKTGEAILFEGYMDVMAAYQAGIKHVVATMGTSLTEHQAKLLKRYVNKVIVCYDGDDAGLEASFKAAKLLRDSGCNVKIADMTDNNDPDQFIATHGKDAFEKEVLQVSDTYMTFMMRYLKKDYNLSLEADKINYLQQVLKELAMVESSLEREHYLQELSNEFSIPIDALKDDLTKIRRTVNKEKDKTRDNRYNNHTLVIPRREKILSGAEKAERRIIYHMLHHKWVAERVQLELGASFKVDAHKIIVTHLYGFYEEGHMPDISKFLENIEDESLRQRVREIILTNESEEINDDLLTDYIRSVKVESSELRKIASLKEELSKAERESNPIKAATLAQEIVEIQRKLKNY